METTTEATATRAPAAASPLPAKEVISADSDGAPADASKPGAEPAPPTVPRKIIYTAQVTLVVENLSTFDKKFQELVKESGGYVSQTDQTSRAESQRHASWTIRVPVERFSSFLAAISGLGELQQSHLDSQDVTMEYYDLEARISNKQQEEKRLLKHLADSTGNLVDILAVERELTRVRGEIEQMQGRIRYLGNLSALSTVTVTVDEIHNYTPPVHPTFADQIKRTFNESLGTLIDFGKAVVLLAVALAPWSPLILIAALVVLGIVRRLLRTRNRQEPVVLTRPGP